MLCKPQPYPNYYQSEYNQEPSQDTETIHGKINIKCEIIEQNLKKTRERWRVLHCKEWKDYSLILLGKVMVCYWLDQMTASNNYAHCIEFHKVFVFVSFCINWLLYQYLLMNLRTVYVLLLCPTTLIAEQK